MVHSKSGDFLKIVEAEKRGGVRVFVVVVGLVGGASLSTCCKTLREAKAQIPDLVKFGVPVIDVTTWAAWGGVA